MWRVVSWNGMSWSMPEFKRFLPQVCARSTPTTSPSPPSPRAGGLGRRSSMCLHESSGPTRWRNTWVLMWRLLTLALQERCILDGTLTVNYEQVDTEYRLRHNDLLANIVHRYADTPSAKRRPLTQVYNPNPGPGLVRPSGGGVVQHYSTLLFQAWLGGSCVPYCPSPCKSGVPSLCVQAPLPRPPRASQAQASLVVMDTSTPFSLMAQFELQLSRYSACRPSRPGLS